jgi:hypothetical protein
MQQDDDEYSSPPPIASLIAYLESRLKALPVNTKEVPPHCDAGLVGLFRVAHETGPAGGGPDDRTVEGVAHQIQAGMHPSLTLVADLIKKNFRHAFNDGPVLPLAWAVEPLSADELADAPDARELAELTAKQVVKLGLDHDALMLLGSLLAVLCAVSRIKWMRMDAFNLFVVFVPQLCGGKDPLGPAELQQEASLISGAHKRHMQDKSVLRLERLISMGRRINGVFAKSRRILAAFATKHARRRSSLLSRMVISTPALKLEHASSRSARGVLTPSMIFVEPVVRERRPNEQRDDLDKEGLERQLPQMRRAVTAPAIQPKIRRSTTLDTLQEQQRKAKLNGEKQHLRVIGKAIVVSIMEGSFEDV